MLIFSFKQASEISLQPRVKNVLKAFLLLTGCLSFGSLLQAKSPEVHLRLENHLFYPPEVVVPAEQKVKLIIFNGDSSPEEFDSFDLNREKMLFPGRKTTIYIGPLAPGEYSFFGEYHPYSATGVVVVKEGADVN